MQIFQLILNKTAISFYSNFLLSYFPLCRVMWNGPGNLGDLTKGNLSCLYI